MRLNIVMIMILVSMMLMASFGILLENAKSEVWGPEQEISPDTSDKLQASPSVAAEGNEVHFVWLRTEEEDLDVYYRQFDRVAWQPEQEISVDVGNENQWSPKIAVEGEEVHVVWVDERDGDQDIYYRRFDGTNWLQEQEISNDVGSEDQELPSIAVDGGKVHVVWQDDVDDDHDVHYRLFDGIDWQPQLEMGVDTDSEMQSLPSVAAENGRAHVVWIEGAEGEYDVYYANFDGTDWHPEERISGPAVGLRTTPAIAAEDGEVHVVWIYSSEEMDYGIYYTHFDGTNWQPESRISYDTVSEIDIHFCPSIAVESGVVYVAWDHVVGMTVDVNSDIRFRYFYQSEWQPEQEISIDTGEEIQMFPQIAAGNGSVHIVWLNRIGQDYDVYYRMGESFPTQSDREEVSFLEQYWWTLALVAVVAIVITIIVWRIRKPPEPELEMLEEEWIQQPED